MAESASCLSDEIHLLAQKLHLLFPEGCLLPAGFESPDASCSCFLEGFGTAALLTYTLRHWILHCSSCCARFPPAVGVPLGPLCISSGFVFGILSKGVAVVDLGVDYLDCLGQVGVYSGATCRP